MASVDAPANIADMAAMEICGSFVWSKTQTTNQMLTPAKSLS